MFVPEQIVLAAPAAAAGKGFTVTITLLLFVQPVAVIVSTTVYVVFTVGLTVGLAAVEVKPTGTDVQLYVLPGTAAAPRVVFAPEQIVLSAPAAAAGKGVTVTITLLLFVQPVAVIVSTTVYVVFTVGLTVGLAAVEVKPTGTDVQLYVLPGTAAAPRVVLVPEQIVLAAPAAAAGKGFTVTITLLLFVQPVAVIVSTTVYVVFTVGLTVGLAAVEVKPTGTDVQLYVLPGTAAAPRVGSSLSR